MDDRLIEWLEKSGFMRIYRKHDILRLLIHFILSMGSAYFGVFLLWLRLVLGGPPQDGDVLGVIAFSAWMPLFIVIMWVGMEFDHKLEMTRRPEPERC